MSHYGRLNATADTPPPGPVSAGRGAPAACRVARFHSRTYPSVSALASSLLSALNATPVTLPLVTAGSHAVLVPD